MPLSHRSVLSHAVRRNIALSATTACCVNSRLRHFSAGSPPYPAETGSSSYGPTVRFRLLPTPPHDDAVTFSYGAVANSDRDLHPASSTPSQAYTKRLDVVILNDVAWSIIKAQRGLHPIWVFPFRGKRIDRMNNNGWQEARQDAGLPLVRVHDLRHSFGARLRAAGVSAEDREALLGHANHSMAGHYASPDVGRLLAQANLIVDRRGTRTLLRIAERQCGRVNKSSHRVPQRRKEDLVLHAKSFNAIGVARTGG